MGTTSSSRRLLRRCRYFWVFSVLPVLGDSFVDGDQWLPSVELICPRDHRLRNYGHENDSHQPECVQLFEPIRLSRSGVEEHLFCGLSQQPLAVLFGGEVEAISYKAD